MTVRQYVTASIINLAFLGCGFILGHELHVPRVQAQSAPAPPSNLQEIAPGVTTGTFGAGLILAHEIQSDSLVVNGYDVMKLQQNTLNYLATRSGGDSVALQQVVNQSRPAKLYTVKQPTPPAPPKSEEKKP